MIKKLSYFVFSGFLVLIFSLIFQLHLIDALAMTSASVDVRRLTFNNDRDDWPVIYKDSVYWIDARGGIYGYNFSTNTEFPFYTGTLPFLNLYGLVGFNGRLFVYDSYDGASYNVRIFDTLNNADFAVSNELGSRAATDVENNKVAYVEGYGYGDLYVYEINKKESTFIAHDAAVPKISGNIVVWYISTGSGTYDIRAYDLVKKSYIDIPNPNNESRSVPDVNGNKIVFSSRNGFQQSIKLYDLAKNKETTLIETISYDLNWPAISNKYVVWGKSIKLNVAGVEGINLQTGEVFEVQSQGSFQNSNLIPSINGNIVSWFDWRTGNGDIYSAMLNR